MHAFACLKTLESRNTSHRRTNVILKQGEGVQVCANHSEEEEPPESMEFSHWSKEGTQFIVPILRHSFFFPSSQQRAISLFPGTTYVISSKFLCADYVKGP